MYEFIIGETKTFASASAPEVVAFTEREGFHLVTEVLGVYTLAHPDGRTGLVRVA